MKYRRIILIAFIVLVGASIIYALMDKRTVTTSSEKAYQAYLQGDDLANRFYQQEALHEFERAAKIDPSFAMAFARMAWLYKTFDRQKEYLEAKNRTLSLIDRVTDKEKLIINVGFARADDRSADLERYSKELMDKYPDSVEAHEILSETYLIQRNYDKVIEENLVILKKKPNYAQSYNLLGYAYFYKGEYEKALEYIDKYSSMAPDQANPHDSHGEMLLNMGRYDEALVQFRTADSIKSGLYFVVAHLGDTYCAKGMYRDAIGAYLKARDLGPNEKYKVTMDGNIAMCYMENKQFEKAASVLQEAISKVPDDLRCNGLLGGADVEQGKMDDALVQLGIVKGIAARLKMPQDTSDKNLAQMMGAEHYLVAKIAMSRGEYATAVTNFENLYEHSMVPERVFYAAFLGDALVKAGLVDSAIAIMTGALKDNPNSNFCLRALADAYGKAGRRDAQKETLARYLEVMKDADDGNPFIEQASTQLEQLTRSNS
ncbi:MAG TPA: hypothetical protein DCZ43_02790 [candidate division Zixibacteria bacterium]|nr:hypothetical protein [candidate division Zixibacteria bacterium]